MELPDEKKQEISSSKVLLTEKEVMEAYGIDVMMARTLMPLMKYMDVSKYSEVIVN